MGKCRAVWVGIVVLFAQTARAEPAGPSASASSAEQGGARRVSEQRTRRLERYIRPDPVLTAVEPYWPAIGGALCTVGAIGAVWPEALDSPEPRPYVVGLLGTCAVASFASYALPSEYRNPVASAALFGATGGSIIAVLHFDEDVTPAARVTTSAFAGSVIAFGGLVLLDSALSRPVTLRTLAAHADNLAQRGGSMTEGELRGIELDFARTERPIPRWAFGATQIVAGIIAASPGFVAGTSKDDRLLAYLTGGYLATQGATSIVIAAVAPNKYADYLEAKDQVEISPLGPQGSLGLSLLGRF